MKDLRKRFTIVGCVAAAVFVLFSTVAVNANVTQSPNFVDERYELVALVFRLAESRAATDLTPETANALAPAMTFYNGATEYMRLLNSTFGGFVNHPIVNYIVYLWQNGYYPSSNDVFSMAIHLERIGGQFVLADNISRMIMPEALGFNTWTEENTPEFVALLNDFYRDTNFATFFESQRTFYEEISAELAEQVVDDFNFEWFEQFGIERDDFRLVLSPSKDRLALGVTIYNAASGEWVAYAGIPVMPLNADGVNHVRSIIAHELAHSFSNPMAEIWYAENEEFRGWVHSTLQRNEQQMLQKGYGLSIIVAFEYVTRAHETLYMVENTNSNLWWLLAQQRFNHGFRYIENVYAMVTGHTPMLHIIVPTVITGAALLLIVLPAVLIMRWRKRRKYIL